MMKDLVIMRDNVILYLSDISEMSVYDPNNQDLLFFSDGRVRRFKKNGIVYMAIFDRKDNKFRGYYSERNFWAFNRPEVIKNDTYTTYSALGFAFSYLSLGAYNYDANDNLVIANKELINDPVTGALKYNVYYKRIPFNAIPENRDYLDFLNPSGYEQNYTPVPINTPLLQGYYNFIINKKFLGVDGQLRELTIQEIEGLTDIVFAWDFVFTQSSFLTHLSNLHLLDNPIQQPQPPVDEDDNGLLESFNAHLNLPLRFSPPSSQIDPDYHKVYNEEYFAVLRLNLIEFKYWLSQFDGDYDSIKDSELVVRIVNLFSVEELSYLSYGLKINLLNRLLYLNTFITQGSDFNKLNEEEAVLRIVRSIKRKLNGEINYSEINLFLAHLNNLYYYTYSDQTLFEILYDSLDDKRLERYLITSWFVNEQSNRKNLIYTIYDLWKTSEYNSYYIPSGVTPIDSNLNPDAYFLNIGASYYENTSAVLAFSASSSSNMVEYISTEVYFESELINKEISITQIESTQRIVSNPNTTPIPVNTENKVFVGNFHLYQPLTIVGYKANLELVFPQKAYVPAFLFYYVQDFDRLRDFDAAVGLAIEIAIEAAIFYFTGGLSSFQELHHLKHVSNILKAMRGQLGQNTAVELWSGLTATGEILSINSSVLVSANNYIASSTNDPEKKVIAEKMSAFFIVLTLGTGLGAIYSRAKATTLADEILAEVNALPPGSPHDIDDTLKSTLIYIKNNREVDLTLFRNKILNLDLVDDNRVFSKYITYSEADKFDFYQKAQYYTRADWENMNLLYARTDASNQIIYYTKMDLFEEVIHLKPFRGNIEFLSAFNRFKFLKQHEIDHIANLYYNNGKFKPIGGHWNDIFASGSARSFTNEIPPTTFTTVNGHIKYENLYFKRPAGVTSGGIEIPVGSGNFYKVKTQQYIINPTWNISKLQEEMAYAFSRKIPDGPPIIGVPRFGKTNNFVTTNYKSYFSDGTEIGIMMKNYDKDPVTQNIMNDHLGLMFIK